jgi:hypothetical protein
MIGFKAIFWDSGGIWLLLLAMTIGFILNQVRYVIDTSKHLTRK